MKNLLWFALGAGAVYLYMTSRKKDKKEAKEVLREEVIKAQSNPNTPKVHPNIMKNRATFNDLRAVYNDSEAATVAPSIKAPIGIF